MSDKSKNQVLKLKQIKSGLAIYQTGRSPFWYARLWDTVAKKYVRRSTKETSRIDAIEAAIEFADTYRKFIDPSLAVTKDRSFEAFARRYDAFRKAQGTNARSYSDARKILYREGDGLISYFGKLDVAKITSGTMRDFLVHLDSRREQPLANSTKAKQCMVVRQVLRLAFEDGLIERIPESPKLKTVDKPRITFTELEYKKLMTTARKCAARGDVVRGVNVTEHHVKLFSFVVHSFLRPTEKELFGIRHCDIENKGNGPKQQEQWIDALFEAFQNKKSNYQFQIGVEFDHAKCETMQNSKALALLAQSWLACRPLIDIAKA